MKRLRLLIASVLSLGVLLVPAAVAAQNVLDPACTAAGGQSSVCGDKDRGGNPLYGKNGAITKATNIISYFVGVAAVFMLVVGGIRYIFSHGDASSVNQARNTIIYALAGIFVAAGAQAIIAFVLNNL